jgi:hypothetical protein
MKCPNCSADCTDDSSECRFCGQRLNAVVEHPAPSIPINPYQHVAMATPVDESVPNHLVWAIIATIIATMVTMWTCCLLPIGLPTGITAIVYGTKVNQLLEMGDRDGAEKASKNAKIWCWITTTIALIFGLWSVFTLSLIFLDPEFLKNLPK